MKFIIQDEINAVQQTQQEYLNACILDKQATLDAKDNVNTLLASKQGLMASFGAGFAKGMVSQPNTSSKSMLPSLIQLLMKL
ncbi:MULTISPECIES: hypothetical protein [Psychromonas]|uniref:hypothetical protein n=1 Tax=Psychromonas TaxID=67572 RepID=UPI00040ED93D|nr:MULTISPECIES: hypothetical protein [Psychromonas]MBB1273231.1 hypothetical protein [Psychromonas sp. SR45-3]